MNSNDLTRLHQFIVNHYNLEELRTLCFELSVDYDSLGGEGKAAKARELILRLGRRGKLDKLIEALQREHPEEFERSGFSTDAKDLEALYAELPSLDVAGPPASTAPSDRKRLFLIVGIVTLAFVAVLLVLLLKGNLIPQTTSTATLTASPTATTLASPTTQPDLTPTAPVQLSNIYVDSNNNLWVTIKGIRQPYRLYARRQGATFGDEPHYQYYLICEGATCVDDFFVVQDVNADTIYCVEIKSEDGLTRYDIISYRTGTGEKPFIGEMFGKSCPID